MNYLIYLAEKEKIPFEDPYGGADDWASRWGRFSGEGIQTAILGMLTVFAALAIIWGLLELFHYCFYTLPESRKSSAENEAIDPSEAPAVSEPEGVPEPETISDDGEVVAAIVAAITAMRSEQAEATGVAPGAFRVVSFRRR